MRARIVTIGDELLIGQVVNTNAAWLGERLTDMGVRVDGATVVSDDREEIAAALVRALQLADVVVVTGGLGPTHDDVTKRAVCDVYGAELEFDERQYARVRERFERRGLRVPDGNRGQAEIPSGFEALQNASGTAPGLRHGPDPARGWGALVVLPGVPHEMRHLVERWVLPSLAESAGLPVIVRRTLLTTGAGESNLQEILGPLDDLLGPDLRLAWLPNVHGVRLRITATADSHEAASRALAGLEDRLRERLGRYIFGMEGDTLEGVVGAMLREAGLTVATAESCTGGLVSHRLTNVPGSSDCVRGGVVAYDNAVKVSLLGVPEDTIERHGAVSREVVEAMAAGVRSALGADVGLATSGIMGPGGGTEEKPVGTLWLAVADGAGVRAVRLRLGHDRERNKEQAATAALNLLRRHLVDDGSGSEA